MFLPTNIVCELPRIDQVLTVSSCHKPHIVVVRDQVLAVRHQLLGCQIPVITVRGQVEAVCVMAVEDQVLSVRDQL
jgi:hypothetical protein